MNLNDFINASLMSNDVPQKERLDFVYDIIHEWLDSGNLEKINQLFYALYEGYMDKCVEELPIALGFLLATEHTDEEFRDREKFLQALYRESEERYVESDLSHLFEEVL